MAVIVGGAPQDPKSIEQYEEVLFVLEKELCLIKRKFVVNLKAASGAKLQEERRWYELGGYSQPIIDLVAAGDWAGLAALPAAGKDQTGLYLHLKWASDLSWFALQSVEPRPWEGGRYAAMTPVIVFTEGDAAEAARLFIG